MLEWVETKRITKFHPSTLSGGWLRPYAWTSESGFSPPPWTTLAPFKDGSTWKLASSGCSKFQVFVKYHAFEHGESETLLVTRFLCRFRRGPRYDQLLRIAAWPFPRRRPP